MTKPTQTEKTVREVTKGHISPFEQIRRTNDTGNEYWSSRDFAKVLNYSDYRNFEQVIAKARTSCFNSGQRVDDHFVDVTDMIKSVRVRSDRQKRSICPVGNGVVDINGVDINGVEASGYQRCRGYTFYIISVF